MSNQEMEWIQQARLGDEQAFTLLVERFQSPVYNLCYRMLGNEQEAEDGAQETFWRAYQNIQRFDPQRSFITWLLSIAAHYCIDESRKRRNTNIDLELLPEDSLTDATPLPEKMAAMSEEQRLLHGLLGQLSKPDRSAVILRYWYDFSEEEIARSLSLTVSAVKSRLHRARLQLAQAYREAQPEINTRKERMPHESPAF